MPVQERPWRPWEPRRESRYAVPCRHLWRTYSLTPAQRVERGVPSRLLSVDQVAEAVVQLSEDKSLAGRVLVWWSEDAPRLIKWGDRGYRDLVDF